MKGVFWKEGESFTSSMSLIVSLLIRYPEIATLKLIPEEQIFQFGFIFRRKFTLEEKKAFQEELGHSLMALAEINRYQPQIMKFNFKRLKNMSFLEVKRDIASLSQEEISLITRIITHKYGTRLLAMRKTIWGKKN